MMDNLFCHEVKYSGRKDQFFGTCDIDRGGAHCPRHSNLSFLVDDNVFLTSKLCQKAIYYPYHWQSLLSLLSNIDLHNHWSYSFLFFHFFCCFCDMSRRRSRAEVDDPVAADAMAADAMVADADAMAVGNGARPFLLYLKFPSSSPHVLFL